MALQFSSNRRTVNKRKSICKWPGCTREIKRDAWGCDEHWQLLPAELREEIIREYWPGATPTENYIEVVKKVGRWIAEQC